MGSRTRASAVSSPAPASATLPTTIDEVVARLDQIIEQSRDAGSRLGYFPALYRRVTVKVRDGIAEGLFDDGPRMERFDVRFANRYLDAYDARQAGGELGESWRFAFRATDDYWPIVLQHLLLGMNAHINIDLGVAAARVVPAGGLAGLQPDFNKINEILASLVGEVESQLAEVWPLLRVLDRALGRVDESIINFSMGRARDFAWRVAEELNPLSEEGQHIRIARLDAQIVVVAGLIRHPGFLLGATTKAVRLGERKTPPEIIEILSA